MKQKYNQPLAEELSGLLANAILDASVEGYLEGYGDEQDFTW